MPKPPLYSEESQLEHDLMETMIAGLKEWRPDLDYPESMSDLSGCVRAVMRMFDIKRRALPKKLRIKCDCCRGGGKATYKIENGVPHITNCLTCKGKGYM